MRKIMILGLVVLTVVLILGGTYGGYYLYCLQQPLLYRLADVCATEEEQDRIEEASDTREGGVPDSLLVLAFAYHHLSYSDEEFPEMARNWLRIMILGLPEETVAKNRALVAEQELDPAFLEDFDRAIEWVRNLREGDPRQASVLAEELAAKPEPSSYNALVSRRFLATDLKSLAENMTRKKWPLEARFSDIQDKLNSGDPSGQGNLHWLADGDDYIPAQMDMADRYLEGRGFGKSIAKAYYWLQRAQENGAAVGIRVEALRGQLTKDDIETLDLLESLDIPPFK